MKLNEQSGKGLLYLIIGIIAAIVIFMFAKKMISGISGIFQGLGLEDSAEEKENKTYINEVVNKQNSISTESPWNPAYYTLVPRNGGFAFTTQQCRDLVEEIWDSVGYIYDSPSKAAAAIKQCKNKRNVSFLADGFRDVYKLDLLNWLENKFDTSEQREILAGILRYVNSLPAY